MLRYDPPKWKSSSRQRSRLSANDKIDICRGLFAFLVVIAHSLEMTWSMNPAAPGRLPSFTHRFVALAAGTGIYWVMGFFVISGYCIYLSAQRLVQGNSFPFKTYLLARLTRIVPLYYIALVFTAFIEWWISRDRPPCWRNGLSPEVFVSQLLLIQNFTQTYGSYAPSWSITNEAFYYVFYGSIVFAVARVNKWPAATGMAISLSIGVVMQILYRLGYNSALILNTGLLFGLGINWFLGALVAEHRNWLVRNRVFPAIARCWPLVLALSIGLWCSQRVHLEAVFISCGIAFTLMTVRFVAVDARRGTNRADLTPRQKSVVALLGLSSYPTYLFHGPILMLTGWVILHWKVQLDWRLIWASTATVAIASGIVLGYFAERPIMAWRAGLLKRHKPLRRAPVAGGVQRPILGIHQ
jgi:peptidoglycan/LPS O-acetylase OafA/YrhL